jgi:hypothetical protein
MLQILFCSLRDEEVDEVEDLRAIVLATEMEEMAELVVDSMEQMGILPNEELVLNMDKEVLNLPEE